MVSRKIIAIVCAIARQRSPSLRPHTLLCAGTLRPRPVSILFNTAAPTVGAAKDDAEERLQAGQVACDDADIGFDDGPDREVARVPEPVARSAVCGDVGGLDYSGCCGAVDGLAWNEREKGQCGRTRDRDRGCTLRMTSGAYSFGDSTAMGWGSQSRTRRLSRC